MLELASLVLSVHPPRILAPCKPAPGINYVTSLLKNDSATAVNLSLLLKHSGTPKQSHFQLPDKNEEGIERGRSRTTK